MDRGDERVDWTGASLQNVTGHVAVAYALLASLATAVAVALHDGVPWVYETPWIALSPLVSMLLSAALGVVLAIVFVALTRLSVPRYEWAYRLHLEMRPLARDLSITKIAVIAGFSSLGEELLFRGLLMPWLGVVGSAAVFGLVHQIPGRSRWVWVCWATVVGLALGAIFAATGSLIGPLLAHAIINAVNLAYLRDHDPSLPRTAE